MFKELITRIAVELDRQKIDYMLIGGQAVLYHGEFRTTKDIDITLGVDADGISEVLQLAKSCGLVSRVDDPVTFTREKMVLPCETVDKKYRVDFIFSSCGYEREALDRVNLVETINTSVKYASVEDLIIHKLIAGRPRDLEDVAGIIRKNPARDEVYIRAKLVELGHILSRSLLVEYRKITEQT